MSPLPIERRRRLAELVHGLGPAPMLHLLVEIANGADLDDRLERYAALPAAFIRELGGDQFPERLISIDGSRQ